MKIFLHSSPPCRSIVVATLGKKLKNTIKITAVVISHQHRTVEIPNSHIACSSRPCRSRFLRDATPFHFGLLQSRISLQKWGEYSVRLQTFFSPFVPILLIDFRSTFFGVFWWNLYIHWYYEEEHQSVIDFWERISLIFQNYISKTWR